MKKIYASLVIIGAIAFIGFLIFSYLGYSLEDIENVIDDVSGGDSEEIVNAQILEFNPPKDGVTGGQVKSCVTVANTGNTESRFMIEQGIIPRDLAGDWGLTLFSTAQNSGQCCPGMEIIRDKWYNLPPGAEKEVCVDLRVPNSNTKDLCGDTDYWEFTGDKYTVYATVSNQCNYLNGEKLEGYKQYTSISKDFNVKLLPWF